MSGWLKRKISGVILKYLEKPVWKYEPFSITSPEILENYLRSGDVLLIEGNQRVSSVIKYLTQSTWSHAALYVGDAGGRNAAGEALCLIEADAGEGVIAVPLSKYKKFNSRICRPVNLDEGECGKVVSFALDSLGYQYDQKHIFDLLRYLFPHPPVPLFFRRRMLALGSGDPTRAICSTLIAQAFQSIKYPILPIKNIEKKKTGKTSFVEREFFHIRHYSLFTPRDFDLSPYFKVIKPTIEAGFDHKDMNWQEAP